MKKLKLDEYYKSSDLPLVATLSLFYPIEFIDKSNPTKVEFYFIRNENLNQLVESYWRKEFQVEPQTFVNQIKNLKTRIYSSE